MQGTLAMQGWMHFSQTMRCMWSFPYTSSGWCCLLFLLAPSAFCNPASTLAQSPPLSDVPPGFEHIDNSYQGLATLYVGKQKIGQGYLTYDEPKDTVQLTPEAQQLIMDQFDEKDMTKQGRATTIIELKKPLKANSALEHPYLARSPHTVTTHFSHNMLKLYVYIPPKRLTRAYREYLYPMRHPDVKTEKLASSTRLDADYIESAQDKYVDWRVDGAWSAGQSSLIYNANQSDHFNRLYYQYLAKKYIYAVGYQQPLLTSSVLVNRNFWGVSMNESPKLINHKFYSAYQTPFSLILDKPYYVKILFQGDILFKGRLSSGDHIIDTTNFPPGSYLLTIEKQDLLSGNTTTSTEYFSQQTGLYNWIYSGFELEAGISSDEFSRSANPPQSSYFKIKDGMEIFHGDANLSFTHQDGMNYLGAQYNYLLGTIADFDVQTAVGNQGDCYLANTLSVNVKHSQYRVYTYNHYKAAKANAPDSKRIGLTYIYAHLPIYWYTSLNYTGNSTYTLSSELSKEFVFKGYPLRAKAGLSHDGTQGYIASIGLEATLDHHDMSTRLAVTQDINHPATSLQADTRWSTNTTSVDQHAEFLGDTGEATADLQAELQTQMATFDAAIYAGYTDHHFDIERKQVGIQTNLILSPQGMLLTHHQENTGFVVTLPHLDNKSNHEYAIEDDTYPQGKRIFMAKQPYQHQDIAIKSPSSDYTLQPDEYRAFLYPHNIHFITPKRLKSCFVSFMLNTPQPEIYTLKDHPDFFVFSGDTMTTGLVEGTVLNFIPMKNSNNTAPCKTNQVIDCQNQFIELGTLYCAPP